MGRGKARSGRCLRAPRHHSGAQSALIQIKSLSNPLWRDAARHAQVSCPVAWPGAGRNHQRQGSRHPCDAPVAGVAAVCLPLPQPGEHGHPIRSCHAA